MKSVRAKGRDDKSRCNSPRRDSNEAAGNEAAPGQPIIRLALDRWPAGAVLINRDGRITAANRAAAKLFGYRRRRDLRQVSLTELIPEWQPLANVERGEPIRPQATRRLATGCRLDGRSVLLRYSQLLVETDCGSWTLVSMRARASAPAASGGAGASNRHSPEERLRHAQKIEALGTLAGGIAHDFNNILLAIAGNTRLAMTELPEDHPVQHGLAQIAKASGRATDLVNRILTFSRQGESRREVISLQSAVDEAVQLLRATLPPTMQIRFDVAAGLPAACADATQINQIMINLLTNAAYAIGDENAGLITVALDEATFAPGDIFPPQLTPGRYVRLSISDTGCGMDEATRDRAFDPFFTTKPVGRGTGLGLSVVDGIMRNHEGAILVASEPGRGATFRLYFPAVDAPPAAAAEPADFGSQQQGRGEGRRVMYIDDEEALVFLMSRVLQRQGYEVTGFSDAQQALQVLQERPDDFDVVVTDLSMPGMSGFHVARAIKEFRADLPVIVTSGYVRPEDREVAREIGVRDLVLKPDTVEELAQVLERVFKS